LYSIRHEGRGYKDVYWKLLKNKTKQSSTLQSRE
jgi:hypothetical protein